MATQNEINNSFKHQMTKEEYDRIVEELRDYKETKTKENSRKILEARQQGDLSENAEYSAAKEEQKAIQAKVAELELLVNNAEIISAEELDKGGVNMGSTVVLHDIEEDEDITYMIVGSMSTDSLRGLISIESPLGKAIMHKKKGQVVEVEAPIGTIKYKIKDVHKTTEEEKANGVM